MKKVMLVLAMLAMSHGLFAAEQAVPSNSERTILSDFENTITSNPQINIANEMGYYEKVGTVSFIRISTGSAKITTTGERNLYTDGNRFFLGEKYLPVKENTYGEFRGTNVSVYDYMAIDNSGGIYFFNI